MTNPPADINDGKFYVFGPSAVCTPHSFTIAVTATDPDDPVASVTLYYAPTGSSTLSAAMTHGSGSSWSVTVQVQDAWAAGQIGFFAQSVDSHGNHSGATYSSDYLLKSDQCFL